ncbi:MAG: Radical SAM domain heme biosynthesis protein [Candidatus Ozemobacter sibiricus]|jgi:radical SAM protein with 4Fe4S-binding SPASM domain|uniref:Radical SAM domain heme biosynthesis protein n=1 Tax=Candidatus Ozemobacter sibiricus TaxID=2268124 RepID=A0A367ZKH5_9BACT|nr:MAG: Radical SAM domain heme biosynthesis protein [Candidatus Ozemobacter sibiricus]
MFGFQWHVTDLCNRRCRHCYQSSFSRGAGETDAGGRRTLAAAILGAIPDEPVAINLTGGEPLLLPDLIDLMAHLESFPNLAEICIITNGTIDDESLLRRLGGFPRFSSFKISVESGDPAINDAIRGSGSFERLRTAIPRYADLAGRPVVLMMTLSRLNVGTIRETVAFARQTGAQSIIFERFVPLGQGERLAATVLSAADWARAIVDIGAAAGISLDPDDLAACRAFWLRLDPPGREGAEDQGLEAALCNLGAGSMALMPDGTVFPCRRLAIPIGNLLREPFPVIRARLAEWETARLRPRLRGTICGNCPYEDCPGCRALARALTGDPLADDPQCVLHRDEHE